MGYKHDLSEKQTQNSQPKKVDKKITLDDLRLEWNELIKICDPFKMDKSILVDFFRKVWPVVIEPVLIHSLFKTSIVEEIIQDVMTLLIRSGQMNLYDMNKNAPLGRSCNKMITGCKSVGKTLLMKGLKLFIQGFCSEFTYVIFIDFSHQPTLISSVLNPMTIGDFTDTNVSAWCQNQNKTLIVFGDEFQSLYEVKSNTQDLNIKVIRELLAVGKSVLSLGIISGSSAATKALAYQESNLKSIKYDHGGFSDLNRECYKEVVIPPMRNREELTRFLTDRNISLAELDNYMNCTGGVGGRMLDVYRGTYNEKTIRDELLRWIDTDKQMAFIIRLLFLKNKDNKDRIWSQKSIQIYELPSHLFPHPYSTLLEACDEDLLIVNENQAFEFLMPVYYDLLDAIHEEHPDKYLLMCLQGVLMKWGGSDTLGHKIEEEIRKRIINLSEYSEYSVFDGILSFDPSSKVDGVKFIFDYSFDKILYFTKETGVDGLLIMRDNSIHLFQIKIGEYGKTFKLGKTGKKSRNTLMLIVDNAKSGYLKFEKSLGEVFKDVVFNVRSLTLITSKGLHDDAAGLGQFEWSPGNIIEFNFVGKEGFKELFEVELKQIALV
eukprot:NODE_313_length_10011_cov_0.634584.p2 type:complete len:604 gc:universal NODE_313_length_10011_cov_0.634584:2132-321(-)